MSGSANTRSHASPGATSKRPAASDGFKGPTGPGVGFDEAAVAAVAGAAEADGDAAGVDGVADAPGADAGATAFALGAGGMNSSIAHRIPLSSNRRNMGFAKSSGLPSDV